MDAPEILEAVKRIASAAQVAGKPICMMAANAAEAASFQEGDELHRVLGPGSDAAGRQNPGGLRTSETVSHRRNECLDLHDERQVD